ncbi:hypothetical protein SAY86_008248 [Trapa natans]|uniref:GRAS family transcription factor n=1 Tax=Trapa natans TaxID=22666 RepID=A0AAN7K860_TRANT|nr:hypothetical protein SAY86_008248 [Trapa natans]
MMPVISTNDRDQELVFPFETGGSPCDPKMSLNMSSNAGGESPSSSYVSHFSDPVLKYINQMLMEENMEEEFWISPNDIALQDTEKSLYNEIDEQYPDLNSNLRNFDASQFIESPDSNLSANCRMKSGACTTFSGTNYSNNMIGSSWLHDPAKYDETTSSDSHPPLGQDPVINLDFSSVFHDTSVRDIFSDPSGLVDSSVQVKTIYNDNDYALQFKRGLEEARRFLPQTGQLVIDFGNAISGTRTRKGVLESIGKEVMLNESRGRKNHRREDLVLVEANPMKQLATFSEPEEAELSEMLDKVLLCSEKVEPLCSTGHNLSRDAIKEKQIVLPTPEFNCGWGQGWRNEHSSSVDLKAFLVQCAQAVSSNELRTAFQLLKKIRENSSPSGDGPQRLAYYFANGLEARMAGDRHGTESYYASVASKRTLVADVLRAYQLHFSSCPFMRFSIFYMNWMIQKFSQKASVLHIIDFGIGFGFKFPSLIQKLGEQAGGPPKLRITGIEFPQPGLRPSQRNEETGRRLAKYCERFGVPFEYNALPSRNWEAIKIKDLKIRSGETVVVTCLIRFEALLDETVDQNSPKDAVLSLIKMIRPDIVVHSLTNGSYNMPFFVTRFKEALAHLSSIYDMLHATIPDVQKNSEERRVLESEIYGREVMNVVACEGIERVDRPETYKKWQVRYGRAGFKQVPLDQRMMEKFGQNLKAWYHRDFVLDEDGDWMLIGWKGRIMIGVTSWIPV